MKNIAWRQGLRNQLAAMDLDSIETESDLRSISQKLRQIAQTVDGLYFHKQEAHDYLEHTLNIPKEILPHIEVHDLLQFESIPVVKVKIRLHGLVKKKGRMFLCPIREYIPGRHTCLVDGRELLENDFDIVKFRQHHTNNHFLISVDDLDSDQLKKLVKIFNVAFSSHYNTTSFITFRISMLDDIFAERLQMCVQENSVLDCPAYFIHENQILDIQNTGKAAHLPYSKLDIKLSSALNNAHKRNAISAKQQHIWEFLNKMYSFTDLKKSMIGHHATLGRIMGEVDQLEDTPCKTEILSILQEIKYAELVQKLSK